MQGKARQGKAGQATGQNAMKPLPRSAFKGVATKMLPLTRQEEHNILEHEDGRGDAGPQAEEQAKSGQGKARKGKEQQGTTRARKGMWKSRKARAQNGHLMKNKLGNNKMRGNAKAVAKKKHT
jgi:hypothetical protein